MRQVGILVLSLTCLLLLDAAGASASGMSSPGPTTGGVHPQDVNQPRAVKSDPGLETLTHGSRGLGGRLADYGIEVTTGITNVYQANVHDGLGTHQKSSRLTGSYDLQLAADLEKSFGVPGLGLFVHGQGGWLDTRGINEGMVGSVFGVNADAMGDRALDVVEAMLEWDVFDGVLSLAAGKIDLTAFFDASEYANDETIQFLNKALVNNPTIPFPDYGLGVILAADLVDWWRISAGAGDAQADGRQTGFHTAFHGEPCFLYLAETAILSRIDSPAGDLSGNYRFGMWYDPQPKTHSDSVKERRDDAGFYISVDQALLRENDDPQDTQGLGVFARYGYADETRNDIGGFWSVGVQYQGLLVGRDDDVLAAGFAQGTFSDQASASFPADHESVLELYYSLPLTPWAVVSPGVQYLRHSGGGTDVDDALVVGARAQVSF